MRVFRTLCRGPVPASDDSAGRGRGDLNNSSRLTADRASQLTRVSSAAARVRLANALADAKADRQQVEYSSDLINSFLYERILVYTHFF